MFFLSHNGEIAVFQQQYTLVIARLNCNLDLSFV